MTQQFQHKAIPLVRDLIFRAFSQYGGDSDPFARIFKVREYFSANPELIKKALAGKGISFDDKFPEDFISKEISAFHAGLVMQPVNRFIENSDFEFLSPFSDSGALSLNFIRERIYFIFKNSFNFSTAQIFLKSSCNIFQYNVLERYLTEIFSEQGRFSGLLKSEVPELSSLQQWIDFVGTLFLVRPLVYVKMSSCNHLPIDYENMGEFIKWVIPEFSPLPERVLEEGVKSFLPGSSLDLHGALSGFISLLDTMYRIQPIEVEAKAEESSDKSWLAMAMINADHFSFDKTIIEELYLIAGDNKW